MLDLAFKEVKKADDPLSQEEVMRVIEGSQLKATNKVDNKAANKVDTGGWQGTVEEHMTRFPCQGQILEAGVLVI